MSAGDSLQIKNASVTSAVKRSVPFFSKGQTFYFIDFLQIFSQDHPCEFTGKYAKSLFGASLTCFPYLTERSGTPVTALI